MNDYVVLAAAALGLIVNTLAVLAIAWRGGRLLGRMDQSMVTLSEEVRLLRVSGAETSSTMARTVAQLDGLERRVEHLEDQTRKSR